MTSNGNMDQDKSNNNNEYTSTSSNDNNIQYEFTTHSNHPTKIIQIQLELVSFTLVIKTMNGEQYMISDATKVQSILNDARDFNKSLDVCKSNKNNHHVKDDASCSDVDDYNGNDHKETIHVEIKLDPVNSINTYRIPV